MGRLALLSLILLGCSHTDRVVASGSEVMRLADAEIILGERAVITDSSSSNDGSVEIHKFTFTAQDTDQVTRKLGNLYYMSERYTDERDADRVYDGIRSANQHLGISDMPGVGDEAYYHTDNTNFYFVMARKGTKTIRMKVNKTTSKTSPAALKEIAARIVSEM
jgi:hypothetical protein